MKTPQPLLITELKITNVLKVRAAHITPEGNVVTVGGRNTSGKSSVLRSIAMVIGGAATGCEVPIHEGSDRGEVEMHLAPAVGEPADMIAKRTWTPSGSTLAIRNAEGLVYPKPQAIMDALASRVSFDPIAFMRLKPAEQRDMLIKLVGVDTSTIDAQRKAAFERRAEVNRAVALLKGKVDGAQRFDDAPAGEVSVTDLIAEMSAREKVNAQNAKQRGAVEVAVRRVDEAIRAQSDGIAKEESALAAIAAQITELQKRLDLGRADHQKSIVERESVIASRKAAHAQLTTDAESLVDADVDAVRTAIAESEGVNRRVRANAAHASLTTELAAAQSSSAELTASIAALDASKADALASAKFPVAELGFDDTGPTYKGLPLDQASSAEQIRVSVGIGIAKHPRLRVGLIENASLLDAAGLRTVAEMAAAEGIQVWLERVSERAEDVQVFMEDGEASGPATHPVEAVHPAAGA